MHKKVIRAKKLAFLRQAARGVPIVALQEVHVRRPEKERFQGAVEKLGYTAYINYASEAKKKPKGSRKKSKWDRSGKKRGAAILVRNDFIRQPQRSSPLCTAHGDMARCQVDGGDL